MSPQEPISDSQPNFRLLSQATDEGLAIVEDGVIIDANETLAKITGRPRVRLVSLDLAAICAPDTYEELLSHLRRGDEEPFHGRAVTRDGLEVPVKLKAVEYENDHTRLAVVVFGDLSRLEAAEEKLRLSEERYRLLFDSMHDGFVLHEMARDSSGVVVDCRLLEANKAFAELLGTTTDELKGRTMADHLPSIEPNWIELYEKVVALGEPIRLERYFAKSDRCLEIRAFSPRDGEMASIVTDATERKKLEARLRQAAKMEAIGTLASGVAHEINNPINIIMNYAGLILRPNVERKDVETFAKEIVHESERIATIVRNLLAFARQEQEMHGPAKMSAIVETTLSLMKKVLDNDQITVKVDVPEDLPEIRCRQQQIEQVLVNLMTNARHALNERYPGYDENKQLHLSAVEVERDGHRWIRTTIRDHGPGISPDVVDRIFDPFFTTKSGGTGTGLGLSVSHGIVDDHHGRMTVESELGEYTQFDLDLPVYDPDTDWPVDERLEDRLKRVRKAFY